MEPASDGGVEHHLVAGALCIAEGFPYESSHRHFSHAMAIHPLGLLNWGNGGRERAIIEATVAKLEACGPHWWTGYSYAWFANMKARIHDGEGAARALRDFAESFCLPKTFHANGDQSGRGKSDYDYRPFTLEGNFAFAAGVQGCSCRAIRGSSGSSRPYRTRGRMSRSATSGRRGPFW